MKTKLKYFHHFEKWEDHKHGFYSNQIEGDRNEKLNKVVEMFNCEKTTKEMMFHIVDNWKYSCEQNLTNPSVNKIAYIGQCACCAYAGIPSTITMKAWSLLSYDVKQRSNKLAKEAINRWKSQIKTNQLCLKLD